MPALPLLRMLLSTLALLLLLLACPSWALPHMSAPGAASCPFQSRQGGGARAAPPSALTQLQAPVNTSDPMYMLNQQLGTDYNLNQMLLLNATLADGSVPVVVASEGGLQLYLHNYSVPTLVSEHYAHMFTELKQVAHLPLASFVMMQPSLAITPDNEETVHLDRHSMQQLSDYLAVLNGQNARDSLADSSRSFTPQQLATQQEIFDACHAFLTAAYSAGSFTRASLSALVAAVRPGIDANLRDATDDFLSHADAVMQRWRTEVLSAEQWEQMRVIVMGGSHMARTGLIYMQYFSRLLNSPMLTELRVIYAESSETASLGFPLLATHLLDFSVGRAFFNSAERMHSDLMAPAAEIFLDTLLPGAPNPNLPSQPECEHHKTKDLNYLLIAVAGVGGMLVGVLLSHLAHRCAAKRNDKQNHQQQDSDHAAINSSEMQHGLLSHSSRQSLTAPLVL